MKLLLDENLPAGLKRRLSDICPVVAHVKDYDLLSAPDEAIWQLARTEGFTIVSKDEDFRNRLAVLGHPPRIILIKLGNSSVEVLEAAIRKAWEFVLKLHDHPDASLLLIAGDAAFLLREPKRA